MKISPTRHVRRSILLGGSAGALVIGTIALVATGHVRPESSVREKPGASAPRTPTQFRREPIEGLRTREETTPIGTTEENDVSLVAFLKELNARPEHVTFEEGWALRLLSDPSTPATHKAALLERLRERNAQWRPSDAPRWEAILRDLIAKGDRHDVSFKAGRLFAQSLDSEAKRRLGAAYRARRDSLSLPTRLGFLAAIEDTSLLVEVLSDPEEEAPARRQAAERFAVVAPTKSVALEFERSDHPRELRRALVRGVFRDEPSDADTLRVLQAAKKADVVIAATFALATSKQPRRLRWLRQEWDRTISDLGSAPHVPRHFSEATALGSSMALAFHGGEDISVEERRAFLTFIDGVATLVSRQSSVDPLNQARATLVVDWIQACVRRRPDGCGSDSPEERGLRQRLSSEMNAKLADGQLSFLLRRKNWLP